MHSRDRGDHCIQWLHSFSNPLSLSSKTPEFQRGRAFKRQDASSISFLLDSVDQCSQPVAAASGIQPFGAVAQFREHRRAQIERIERLGLKPRQDAFVRSGLPWFRHHVRVEDDHSKSGGFGISPRYSKTRSSPRSSSRINEYRYVPIPIGFSGISRACLASAFISSDKLLRCACARSSINRFRSSSMSRTSKSDTASSIDIDDIKWRFPRLLRLPLRRLGEFLDHAVALELGDVVDEKHAVGVIDLVLQHGREQTVRRDLLLVAGEIHEADFHFARPLHLLVVLRDREAAFLVSALLFRRPYDLRIDEHL